MQSRVIVRYIHVKLETNLAFTGELGMIWPLITQKLLFFFIRNILFFLIKIKLYYFNRLVFNKGLCIVNLSKMKQKKQQIF